MELLFIVGEIVRQMPGIFVWQDLKNGFEDQATETPICLHFSMSLTPCFICMI